MGRAGAPLPLYDSGLQPSAQMVKISLPGRNGHHQVVDRFGNVEPVAASVYEDLREQTGGSLIPVGEAVIADHSMQNGRCFSSNSSVILRIRAAQCRLDKMEAGNTAQSAIGQSLIVGAKASARVSL